MVKLKRLEILCVRSVETSLIFFFGCHSQAPWGEARSKRFKFQEQPLLMTSLAVVTSQVHYQQLDIQDVVPLQTHCFLDRLLICHDD